MSFTIKDTLENLEYSEREALAHTKQIKLEKKRKQKNAWSERIYALMTWQSPIVHETILIRNSQFIQCTRVDAAGAAKTNLFALQRVKRVLLHETVRIARIYYYVACLLYTSPSPRDRG